MVHWALDRQGMIGGQGKIVEVDESKFGRRKYNLLRNGSPRGRSSSPIAGKANSCFLTSFEHLTVNHSYHFVDPNTQAHTNTIERQWREAKRKVPLCGRRKKHFAGYLARCMFLMHYQDLNMRLDHFLCAAASLYPPA
nr:uncharacterized protein LOC113830018 [Penaeus vannamei]